MTVNLLCKKLKTKSDMRINIASTHRFHLLDLARELSLQGHDIAFYSFVPKKRCISFGLDKKCCHSFTWLAVPFIILKRILPKVQFVEKCWYLAMDYYMSIFMRPCDVYIALGTVYLKSLETAKHKYGAKTILEWGSKYIDEQQRILKDIGAPLNNEYFNDRSRKGYKVADYIAISSNHVKDSFEKYSFPAEKLFMNHYGVDLSMFYPTQLTESYYDIIMVGGWSLRKGCDLIIDLCKTYKYSFLHVGSIVDLPFPNLENMHHFDSVNQKELVKYYAQAKVFLLPSREEGLAMVQAQAVSCGLPLVCSKDSGGGDLIKYVNNPMFIIEMKDYSIDSIHESIELALSLASKQKGKRNYAGDISSNLSWNAYGKRYCNFLNFIQNESGFSSEEL